MLSLAYQRTMAQAPNTIDSISSLMNINYGDSISNTLETNPRLINSVSHLSDSMILQPLRHTLIPFWIFPIFLILFALITLIRFKYSKEFNDVFTVFFSNSVFQQVYREASVSGIRPGYVLLNINFILLTALWIYLYAIRNLQSIHSHVNILLPASFILITLILIIRYFAVQFVSYIISKPKELKFFHFTELQIFRAGGIILFPLILIQYYAPDTISKIASVLALIIFITFFLYRYLRAYHMVSQAYGKNLFHFLIYICTLEIAPVLIGAKLILKNIQ